MVWIGRVLGSSVTDTWVDGKILMKNRELLTLDVQDIKERSKQWKAQLEEFRNAHKK